MSGDQEQRQERGRRSIQMSLLLVGGIQMLVRELKFEKDTFSGWDAIDHGSWWQGQQRNGYSTTHSLHHRPMP